MEQRKIQETLQLVTEANHALRAYHRESHGSSSHQHHPKDLLEVLRPLIPCLAILQSFEQSPLHTALYGHVLRAVQQVVGNDDDVAEKEESEGSYISPPTTEHNTVSESATTEMERAQHEPQPSSSGGLSLPSSIFTISTLRFSDVEGCADAIVALKQVAFLPRLCPGLFTGPRRPWQRVLLYGPPGTGKTLLAQAVSGEMGIPMATISSADLLSKWVGESERQVRAIFSAAASHTQPCLLFLDEIDAICSRRGDGGESEVARRLTTELLLQLPILPPHVMLIGATNLPWQVDSAIRRRFDRTIYIPLPDPVSRRRLLTRHLAQLHHQLSDAQIGSVVEATEGFSAADVAHLLSDAVMQPLEAFVESSAFRLATAEDICAGEDGTTTHSVPAAADCGSSEEDGVSAGAEMTRPTSWHQQATSSPSAHCEKRKTMRPFVVPCRITHPHALPIGPQLLLKDHEVYVPPVTAKHFTEALRRHVATVSAEELQRIESWGRPASLHLV